MPWCFFSRCGSRTGVQNSAKDSASGLSRKDMIQEIPNNLRSQSKRKALKKILGFSPTMPGVSTLPHMTLLISRRRAGWVIRLVLYLEISTSIRPYSPPLCLTLHLSFLSHSLTAVQQTSWQCINATALGYTLTPWHFNVWTHTHTHNK